MRRNIRIDYEYDGSEFYGFQRQPNKRTVQGEIEKALKKMFKEDIDIISSGRTDRGVHALYQVSNFFIDSSIPLENFYRALSNLLPDDILLKYLGEVDEEFHARFSARERGYTFYITWKRDPFKRRYLSYVEKEVDPVKLEKIMEPLLGRHDFSSFRLSDCTVHKPIREVRSVRCLPVEDGLKIEIRGNAFLKSQIRIIVGTALDEYYGKFPVGHLKSRVENPDGNCSKHVIDGAGLYLSYISYEKE